MSNRFVPDLPPIPDEIAAALEEQAVSKVYWVPRIMLNPNDYNPNHQSPVEANLLEQSLLDDGWTEPIVARPNFDIIDGFHRHWLSGRDSLMQRDHGYVPVVFLDKERKDVIMATIRHNRARGEHGIRPMATIIRELIDVHKMTYDELILKLGMSEEEIERLYDQAGSPKKIGGDHEFNKGWVPSSQRTAIKLD